MGPESVGKEKSEYQPHRHSEPVPTGHGENHLMLPDIGKHWGVLSQSIHSYLPVLPSRFSWKLQLKSSSHGALLKEMMSWMEQDDPDTFLSIK